MREPYSYAKSTSPAMKDFEKCLLRKVTTPPTLPRKNSWFRLCLALRRSCASVGLERVAVP